MDVSLALSLDERVTLRMALNDRLHWLEKLKFASDDALVADTVALLAKLDAIPVMPV